MQINWFQFRLIFSGVLLLFLLVSLVVKFIAWVRFRTDLNAIKSGHIKGLLDMPSYSQNQFDQYDVQLLDFRKEIDILMKDVCFDIYDKKALEPNGSPSSDIKFDFEAQIDMLLDGKILDLIKEKDALLLQKDSLLSSLDHKNKKLIKEIVQKMFFLVTEKDKLLREKDAMIEYLQSRLQMVPEQVPSPQSSYHPGNLINVNKI